MDIVNEFWFAATQQLFPKNDSQNSLKKQKNISCRKHQISRVYVMQNMAAAYMLLFAIVRKIASRDSQPSFSPMLFPDYL